MEIETSRFLLRDFTERDRAAFVAYQTDPRYRRLYDISEDDSERAHELFSLFLDWQSEAPRRNLQLGIFEKASGRLCGCAGLRMAESEPGHAVLGLELTPEDWGRFRLAIDVAASLIHFGFNSLSLHTIVSDTASGNVRAERLARWFGAGIVNRRDGPEWMQARGWVIVDWALTREQWLAAVQHRPLLRRALDLPG